ncbi:MAG: glycogen-binding domain-containing protein [Deltaproteobacteria bacterium]|nr:glycogen-binding domain-containing protein [Deltaproteobacteria bacterium]
MKEDRTGIGSALDVHTAPQGLLTRALARHRRSPAAGRWTWLLAAATLAVGFVVGRWSVPPPEPTAVAERAPAAGVVPVRLVCVQQGATQAAVAGSWNDWNPGATPMVRVADDVFATTVLLERGRHEYMFVVDGHTWTPDLAAATWVDDGFGHRNAVIEL